MSASEACRDRGYERLVRKSQSSPPRNPYDITSLVLVHHTQRRDPPAPCLRAQDANVPSRQYVPREASCARKPECVTAWR